MGHDKRLMLAFALSFGMLVLWRVFFVKEPPPPPKTSAPAQVRTTPGQAPAAAEKPPAPVPLPVVAGSKAEEIVVESDLYRVTFSTQGAVVKSWVLKKYRDAKDNLLDVVNGPACEKLGFPMSVNLADEALKNKLNDVLYVPTPAGAALRPPVKLEFTYSDGKTQARKQFAFGGGYEVRAEVSVFDGQRYLPVEVAWPGGFGDQSLPPAIVDSLSQGVYGSPGDLTTVPQRKMKEDRFIPAPLQLAGLEDRYFVSIFLPESPDQAFRLGRRAWTPADWKGKDSDKPNPLIAMLGTPQAKPLAFRLLVAPKDLDVLRSAKPPLDSLVDFGWFSFVAKPLFLGLRYIYERWIHNYGWAIVTLTILINLAMFPLKLKSIRSAQEMQRIAPLVKSIQDRYKQYKFNDPRKQRMNQEIMKLYQEHHINPLGSCLPMVLQLPFLYGFYRVLDLSIELRHAPWILWITDLSAPDRFHLFGIPLPILPTVMIITMFILQKMTPVATADPAQQRMMMVMPIVFGIMFYNFASGLVLYWLTGNIVGIAQQAFINRVMPVANLLPVPRKTAEAKQ
jgi:YidC/Oxa1 family membrane protein insertase